MKILPKKSAVKLILLVVSLVLVYQGLMYYEALLDDPPAMIVELGLNSHFYIFIYTCITALLGWLAYAVINVSGALYAQAPTVASGEPITSPKRNIFWLIVLLGNFFIAYLAIFKPMVFYRLLLEDALSECVSTLFLLAAAGMFLFKGWAIARGQHQKKNLYACCAFLMGLVLFVIGMEEISWGQRIFNIKTPEVFSANDQNEINMHNFASDLFEMMYYLGEFVLFILFPYIVERFALNKKWQIIADFVPSRFVMFAGSIALVQNTLQWDYWLVQWAFFFTLFILIRYGFIEKRKEDFQFVRLFIFFYIFFQAVYIFCVTNALSRNDFPENREFFISFALCVYAWEFMFTKPELDKAIAS